MKLFKQKSWQFEISGGEKLIHFFEKQQFLLCVEADSDYKKLVGRSLQQ